MFCINFPDFILSSMHQIVILLEKLKNITFRYTKILKLMGLEHLHYNATTLHRLIDLTDLIDLNRFNPPSSSYSLGVGFSRTM